MMRSLASTVAIFVVTTVAVGENHTHEDETDSTGKDYRMNVMVDVTPSNRGDTLPLCLAPFMQTVGGPEWSMARLEGAMGHAFQFQMKEGGRHVMHDALDWGVALDILPHLAQFRTFNATKRDTDVDLPALKREARDAVRASLQKGYPSLVWQPMSDEMKANHHHGYCWGLVVGYNEAEETYTVRHPYVSDTYTIRYDAFGQTGSADWFNVRVFEEQTTVDEKTTHLTALRNAVAFANGTRYAPENRRKDRPIGFSAYELWRAAFESEDISLEPSFHHAETLKGRRLSAATYLRELVTRFPEAAEPLEAAATHYDRELESLNPLYDLCAAARESGAWTAGGRVEAARLIGEALKADRDAIANIEAALARIEGSR